MPFALVIVGIVLLIAGLRGQIGNLASLVKSDFTGSGNYIYWVVAILAVGSIGYIKKLQPISDAFLALTLVVLLLANKGFFAQFMAGLSASTANCPASSSDAINQKALAATAAAPGAGYGFTMSPMQPGQIVPSPIAAGPI